MALATRCPACSTVFRISTAQAAAKGGMVRCGQCRNVFNSLDALVRVEDLDVIDEVVVEQDHAAPAHRDGEDAPTVSASAAPAAPDAPAAVAEPTDAPAPAPPQDAVAREWWLPAGQVERTEIAVPDPVPDHALDPRDDAGQLLSDRRTEAPWSGADLESTNPSFMRAMEPPPAHRMARWGLGVLVLVATIALLGQAAYLWRDELSARWPPARTWLVAACEPLQCQVDYPTHLDAITIESASVRTTGPLNVYELTALLRNRDPIEIRYPYLELVLTDLQDRPILRRALRPEDYLPSGRDAGPPPQSGFAAESELPIRILFELSDLRFAGFRVERFYP